MERLQRIWGRYKFPLLILLLGILLMLFANIERKTDLDESGGQEVCSSAEIEQQMEEILGKIAGVGRVKVMLTLESGDTLQLATDSDVSEQTAGGKQQSETVKLNRGSGEQEVVVTRRSYPTYRGAVVVCDGADNSHVQLAVLEAVSVLTRLTAERITVLKWQS